MDKWKWCDQHMSYHPGAPCPSVAQYTPITAFMTEQEIEAGRIEHTKATAPMHGGRPMTLHEIAEDERRTALPSDAATTRTFTTGATRNTEVGKLDFDGFLSPLVMDAYGRYMDFHRTMEDGTTRNSDNWQKGIPMTAYMKCAWRHFLDWWRGHRGYATREGIVMGMLGLKFNLDGYLHEYLKEHPHALDQELAAATEARQMRWNNSGVGSKELERASFGPGAADV